MSPPTSQQTSPPTSPQTSLPTSPQTSPPMCSLYGAPVPLQRLSPIRQNGFMRLCVDCRALNRLTTKNRTRFHFARQFPNTDQDDNHLRLVLQLPWLCQLPPPWLRRLPPRRAIDHATSAQFPRRHHTSPLPTTTSPRTYVSRQLPPTPHHRSQPLRPFPQCRHRPPLLPTASSLPSSESSPLSTFALTPTC